MLEGWSTRELNSELLRIIMSMSTLAITTHASQACSRKTRTLPLTKPTFSTLQKCGFSAILMTFNDLISYLGSIL